MRSVLGGSKGLIYMALWLQFVSPASGSEDSENGWEVLFDGESTAAWREIGSTEFPGDVWVVEDGCMRLVPNKEDGRDLISLNQYRDFELRFEWKISEGGNSGIKYMVQEDQLDSERAYHRKWATITALVFLLLGVATYLTDLGRPKTLLMIVFTGISALSFSWVFRSSQPDGNAVGLEFQLYDDWEIKRPSKNLSSGALYDLLAPTENRVYRAGEFNSGKIIVRGVRAKHWINGRKILDYELGSEFLNERIANSKFQETPGFGQKSAGHISLQNHRDEIWFRNIRIRRFPDDGNGFSVQP